MKIEHKIIALSIILGFFVWAIDTLLDYLFFYKDSFPGLLIFDLRSIWLAFFSLLGILISRVIVKQKKAEKALSESEERYRKLVELAPDAIAIHSEGRIVFSNTAGAKLMGAEDPAQLIGKKIMDIVHPDYREIVKERMRQMGDEGKSVPLTEEKFIRLDGSVIDVDVTAMPFTYRGRPGMQVIVRDITERKQMEEKLLRAYDDLEMRVRDRTSELVKTNEMLKTEITRRRRTEEALSESEARYRELAESIDEVFFAMDRDLRYTYWNKASENLTGVQAEDAHGKSLYELFPGVRGTLTEEKYLEVLKTKQPQNFVSEYKLAGKNFFFEINAYPTKSGISVIAKDITARQQAEEALRENEEKFRSIVEQSGDGIVLIDERGMIIEWNRAEEEIIGLEQAETVGRPLWDVQFQVSPEERKTPENQERLKAKMLELIGTGRSDWLNRLWETDIQRPDGTRRSIQVLIFLIRTDRSFMAGSITRDVTERRLMEEKLRRAHDDLEIRVRERTTELLKANEALQAEIIQRKHAEETLRTSEERYRRLVEYSPDGIIVHDLREIVIANMAGAKILGAEDPKELIGRSIRQFIHPDYHDVFKERLRMEEKGEAIPLIEEKFLRLDGTPVDVEVMAIPSSYRGKIEVHSVVRDITERKQAEMALQQSEEKYRMLVENIQDGVFIIQDRIIQFANEALARIIGYTLEEIVGKDFTEFIAQEDLKMIEARYYRRQAGEDLPKEYEIHARHKNGSMLILNLNAGIITYQGRVASIGTIKDVTERKKLEAQLLRAQRLDSIGTLASGIAHDINNVLSPIMLSLQLLQEKFTDDESKKLMDILERSAQRGANLIKQIQSFARGAEGEHNPLQVIHLIYEIRQIAKETFSRSIEIKTDIQKDLWTIYGDATQLHQVLMNLCVNARDAMPEGGILSISAENISVDRDYARINIDATVGPHVVIAVSDTGTGISPGIMDRIFEPFFTTKEHGKGTGIGLSTALAIVKGHGGFIDVHSEAGKGTVFKVYLPAIKTPEIETQKAREQHEPPAGHGELILVVDDEEPIRESARSILGIHGYRVITAGDGSEAALLYEQKRGEISIVLMDMMMPVMDGPASIRELRRINPNVKIIAVSGLTENEKFIEVAKTVQAFLPKPFTSEELLRTLHEALHPGLYLS